MPAIPQSEVLAKFFEELGEKCGEILAKFFADFRPSISRENGRKKFHSQIPRHFPRCNKLSFFTAATLGASGPKSLGKSRETQQSSLVSKEKVNKALPWQPIPPLIKGAEVQPLNKGCGLSETPRFIVFFCPYHPFQNHYTHELIIFKLFRGLQLQFFRGIPN